MTTTLRIDEEVYREAKAAAAREGITLTRFIEEGLRLRLNPPNPQSQTEVVLHTFDSGKPFDLSSEDIKRLLNNLNETKDAKYLSDG